MKHEDHWAHASRDSGDHQSPLHLSDAVHEQSHVMPVGAAPLHPVYVVMGGLQFCLLPGQYPKPGQRNAVNMPIALYRGLVIHLNQDMDTFRLVDVGKVAKVRASAPQFLTENA